MSLPSVSVVMPVRDGAQHLAEAVESILEQSLRDFEFIVVDDGSSDETPAILEHYARRDRRMVILRRPSEGYVVALNHGCTLARSPYIARMDADDVSFPERLDRQIAYLARRSDVALLGTAHTEITEDGTVVGMSAYPSETNAVAIRLLVKNCLAHPTVVFSRTVFEQVGGYRTALRPSEDYDLWLRIADRHAIANLDEPLLAYRVHPQSVSMRNLRQQVLSRLAAQAAARIRRAGGDDGLADVELVTVEVVERLGLSRQEIEQNVFTTCLAAAERALSLDQNRLALDLSLEAVACRSGISLSRAERASAHRIATIAALRARMPGRALRSVASGMVARPSLAIGLLRRGARALARRS